MNTKKYNKDLFDKAKNKLNFPRYSINDFWEFCPYSISQLSSKTRKQEIVIWRDLGIFIHYCELKNQEKVGEIFNRDRSIISHIMQKIIYSDTNIKFKESIKKLKLGIMESRIFVVKKDGKLIPSVEQENEKFLKTNKMENKKLVEQILRLCEKQYRKGYQHGFMASENKSLSLKSVEKFRDRGTSQDYKVVEHPLNRRITRAIDRIDSELAMPDMKELIALLNEVYPFNYD